MEVTQVEQDRILHGLRERLDSIGQGAPEAELEWRRLTGRVRARASTSHAGGSLTVAILVLLGVAAASVLFGVGSPSGPAFSAPSPVTRAVPTEPRPAPGVLLVCRTAAVRGALRGDVFDPRYLWVEAAGARIDVDWPAGFVARFGDSIELIAEDGSVVAREGELVTLGGGFDVGGAVFGACSVNGRTYGLGSPLPYDSTP